MDARSWQTVVAIATFANYMLAHWTRKCYTNVKPQFMKHGLSQVTLAAMDSAFMLAYAGGNVLWGALGDRWSAMYVIALGLLGSSACLLALLLGLRSLSSGVGYFVAVQAVHGLFQATGGPLNVAVMGRWYSRKNRGLVFGLWSCHAYIGDVLAALVSAWILASHRLPWQYAVGIPMTLSVVWALLVFCVPSHPREVGVVRCDLIDDSYASIEPMSPTLPAPSIPFRIALTLPYVLNYSLAYSFFKLVNYAMFFQPPLILTGHFPPAQANLISSLYSFGMMPGGVVCGWLSDLYGARHACVCGSMAMALLPLLLVCALCELNSMPVWLVLLLLSLMGCLVSGPNTLITSAVATDLAEDAAAALPNARATGTVTGIINGCGSVTAALGQLAIPYFATQGQAKC
eukprot:g75262.t1